MYKPGYRTSEFWFTLVSFIFSGLFLAGIIREDETKEELISIATHAVESIILIGGQLTIFYKYIKSREKVKKEYLDHKKHKYEKIDKDLEEYVGVDDEEDKININDASIGELIQLPHIGPQVAQRIIDYRETNGLFSDIEELTSVNGIGINTFNKIKNYIIV